MPTIPRLKKFIYIPIKHRKLSRCFIGMTIIVTMIVLYCCANIVCKLWQPKVGSIEIFQSKNVVVRIERIPDSPFPHNKDFTVSSDGKRYAYTSCQLCFSRPDNWCVVVDGSPSQIHHGNIRSYLLMGGTMWPYTSVAFSSNANHVKYNIDGAVFIDGKTPVLHNADRIIDVLFLPNNNTLYCLEWRHKKYLQLNDGKRIPYDENNWVQAIAVNNSINTVATIQAKKDSAIVGQQVEIDGKKIATNAVEKWPYVFEDTEEPVYVFLNAKTSTLHGRNIYSPCIPVFLRNPNKKEVQWYPYGHLPNQKSVPLNNDIAKLFHFTIKNNTMTISFENNNIFSFKIDGYPIAFGLEDNPNHLTLFGKRWGALFKIDVFVKEPNGETGKHEKL